MRCNIWLLAYYEWKGDNWHADWDDVPPPDLESDDDGRSTKGSLFFLSLLIELLGLAGVAYLGGYSFPGSDPSCFWGFILLLLCGSLGAVVIDRAAE
ncbi:hypothetical protein A4R35_17745 [Thermogemmatispora tikiterensis]|uniref:Uncharacterized protein n=1 Tax=Thermogemmatispora tikiterensis TaxID=1825093 RepID=A0A328VTD9_9CHLR|nr:hypothetical protein A4R35_17745 [Thermogemmatispora tikiterensis]